MKVGDLVELSWGICWPLVVVVALVVFHKPLSRFLEQLGRRATKLSVFQFAVELSTVPEFSPAWSGPFLQDVRQPSPADEFSSSAMALFEQIRDDTAFDYAVVDLGTGHQWLTSRLFIFAIVLKRMRGLQCFVFLETRGDVRKRFLGLASPDRVRWALSRRYPWLEAAFANAYSQIPDHQTRSVHGALEPWGATELARLFLQQIQQDRQPDSDENEWVTLTDQETWEHAKWLDAARLESILGNDLQVSWVKDSPDVSPAERAKAVLRRDDPFVALVDEEKKYRSLIDRQALVEKVVKRLVEPSDDYLTGRG